MPKPPTLGFIADHPAKAMSGSPGNQKPRFQPSPYSIEFRNRLLLEKIQFQNNMGDQLVNDSYIVTVNEAAAVATHPTNPCSEPFLQSSVGISIQGGLRIGSTPSPSSVGTVFEGKPCIGTTSLTSCVGIAIHDTENKVTAVTHVLLGPLSPAFEPIDDILSSLLEVAKRIGGARYDAYVFNAENGHRTWNEQLVSHINGLMIGLAGSGVIRDFKHRNEMNFIIDSRDGSIYTGLD